MNTLNPMFPGPSLPDLGTLALVIALVAAAPLLLRPLGRMFGLSGYQSGALAVALVAGVVFLVRTFGGLGLPTFHTVVLGLAVLLALPFVLRATGGVLGVPGRLIRGAWRAGVRLFTPSPISRRVARITPEGVSAWLRKATSDSRDPLLRGDRLAAAEARWSRARYPFLYQTVPADVRRSVVWDGRLLGGSPVTWLAWRHVSSEVLAEVCRSSGRRGLRAGAVTALLAVLAVLAYTLSHSFYAPPVPYPAWSEGVAIMPRVQWYALVAVDLASRVGFNLVLAILGAALLTPAFMYGAFWRSLHAWWSRASAPLAAPTRDSLVIYKHRADVRETEIAAYARQVDLAIRGQERGLPLLQVGTATGIARARGEMRGPSRGTPVCLDGISVRQHMIGFGGTGEGKTEDYIKPMAETIFSADWGPGHKIGGYITDGKGVLYEELANIPALARRNDVRILGTGPDHYGVNIVDGMTPLELSTMMSTITGQVMGDDGEPFWTEQASTIFYHAAVIARVLDLDPDSLQRDEWSAYRPWSLMGIGHLATDQKAISEAVERVLELGGLPKAQQPPGIADLIDSDEVFTSVQYLRGTWATMPNETKGGVIANVNVIVGKFGGAGRLSERFCTGRLPADQVVDVDHALNGGVVMVAVGESDWGLVGRVIATWLKTRLYVAARKKQRLDPESCKRVSVAIFADEFQMLATSGGAESDAEFYNVARSTGCFLIAATQSVASLQKRLGEKITQDLLNNLRSKLCLRLEDKETLDYCSTLAGSTLRGLVVDDGFYETQGQREIEWPDTTPPLDLPEGVTPGAVMLARPRLGTTPTRPAVRLDARFLIQETVADRFAKRDMTQAVIGSQQAAYWRQEDKEKETRSAGLQDRPLFAPGDLKIGSGFAFAYVQRAGGHSLDIVDLRQRAAA